MEENYVMKRRTALRNIIIISAGAAVLPSCRVADQKAVALKNISVSGKQQEMLAALAESIIPKTNNFVGANDLRAHEFVLTMVDDCTSPEGQKIFTDGLSAFEDHCKKDYSTSFIDLSDQQRTELIKTLEANSDLQDKAALFYKTAKQYTIQCFTSSKKYLLDIRKWKMVPGSNFKGCVKIS